MLNYSMLINWYIATFCVFFLGAVKIQHVISLLFTALVSNLCVKNGCCSFLADESAVVFFQLME